MTRHQVDKLVANGVPDSTGPLTLIETHISWLIIGDRFVYKIKRPVHFSFLDFRSLEKRLHFCRREIVLNDRLSKGMYIGTVPIRYASGEFTIGKPVGRIVEYAVKMKKMDPGLQMDKLLEENKVTAEHIQSLARKIAAFHLHAAEIHHSHSLDIHEAFQDITAQKKFLVQYLGPEMGSIIDRALAASSRFTARNKTLFRERLDKGFYRDGHGDLHTANIFLLPEPVPFDCLEFNEKLRQTDVLNDLAFLCMDLDAFGRTDLSDLLVATYNNRFKVVHNEREWELFLYYKAYRANIRAKIFCLRAKKKLTKTGIKKALLPAKRYLLLMDGYLDDIMVEG